MNKTNIPQYLAEHGELTYRIVGVSMNPLLRQDRDLITVLRNDLAPKDTNGRFHKHDVVLYKRHSDGAYVLHRIVEVREKDYVILGDNCVKREYGITDEDILGVMTSFVRDGKTVQVTDPLYKAYVELWCALEPFRGPAKLAHTGARHVQKVVQGEETPKEFAGKVGRTVGRMLMSATASSTFLRSSLKLLPEPVSKALGLNQTNLTKEEQQQALLATGNYLVALLRSVLLDIEPPEKPANVSWNAVYTLAKRHTVDTMAYEAVRRLVEFAKAGTAAEGAKTNLPSTELLTAWSHRKDANVAKNLVQVSERDKLICLLTEDGIDVLPLKGSVLIDMYPNPSWRQMADLDMLIRADQNHNVRAHMERLGYTTKIFDSGKDDCYDLPPFLHVEMHRQLVPESSPLPGLSDYYVDPWRRAMAGAASSAQPGTANGQPSSADEHPAHLYHFSWDDYYLFLLAHFYRHFQVGGSGIRNVMDIHVFLQKHKQNLHEEYLAAELEKLHMADFRTDMEARAERWFGEATEGQSAPEMQQDTYEQTPVNRHREDIDYLLFSSGAYGLVSYSMDFALNRQAEEHRSKLTTGLSYLQKIVFPNYDYMMLSYPWMTGAPRASLPLLWLYRIVHRGWTSRTKIPHVFLALKRFRRGEGRNQ